MSSQPHTSNDQSHSDNVTAHATEPTPSVYTTKRGSILLLIGVLLIAMNLRAPFTGIAPIIEKIMAYFNLTAEQASMLTTLPLLAFALVSPIAAMLAKRFGVERTIFVALLLILAGIGLRLLDSLSNLFIGTAIIGAGIAISNVLLPSIVKRDFPLKAAVLTSAYVLTMGIASSFYSSIISPLANIPQIGWQGALSSFAIVTFITLCVWAPQLKSNKVVKLSTVETKQGNLLRQGLAWQVTIYLGINSLFSYIILAWLPSILVAQGLSEAKAGLVHGAFQLASAIPGLVLIPILAKLSDQRLPAVGLSLLASLSSVGLIYWPEFALIWSACLGFCSGACFILGITFVSLRTHNSHQAARLSGMSQSIGYCSAAFGPILAGMAHTMMGNWHGALWICALAGIVCAIAGMFCGRDIMMPEDA